MQQNLDLIMRKIYPIKINFLTTTFPKFIGDSHAPWILNMAQRLCENGYEVEVITPSAHDLKDNEKFKNVKVNRFRYFIKYFEKVAYGANIPANLSSSNTAKFIFPFFVIGFIFAAFKSIRNANIVHAQFGYSGLFIAFAHFIKNSKTPFFVSFYGKDIAQAKKFKFLYKFVYMRANLIFVLSKDMERELLSAGCPKNKIKVHHLGIDCNEFNKSKNYSKKQNHLLLLVVANFVRKKGIDKIITAFSLLNNLQNDIRLRIVGRGPLEKDLKNLVLNLGLKDKVEFVNNYQLSNPRQYVLKSMAEADIFILPGSFSKDDYGGTPIVLMEAGAMELPCITTINAGNDEIVINGKTGIVLPNQDSEKIADSIHYLVINNKKRKHYGLNARNYILKEFNLEKQIADQINHYMRFIN